MASNAATSPESGEPMYGAIDIGTSSVKCVLLDPAGAMRCHHVGTMSVEVVREAPGQAEIDVEAIWDAVVKLLDALFAAVRARRGRLVRIGLSGHISSTICVDAAGRPLSPQPIWQDQRCEAQANAFFKAFGSKLRSRLGIRLFKGTNWPAPKLRWLDDHHPDVLEDAAYVMQVKDVIFHRLTGLAWSDSTAWLGLAHLTRATFAPELLEWCGVRREQLPELRAPTDHAPLRATSARREGDNPHVSVGLADMAAAFRGFALQPDEGLLLAGTAELIGLATPPGNGHRPRRGVTRYPLKRHGPDLIYGVTANGGASLQWLEQVAGPLALERLTEQAEGIAPGCDGLMFLPYLTGERAPLWDERLTGAFVGLRASHTKAHLLRAVMEGCAMSKRHVLEAIGIDHAADRTLKVAGGSAGNGLWNRIRASVLRLPLRVMPELEPSALGALGCAAAPEHHELERQHLATLASETVLPYEPWTATYDRLYHHYRKLGRALARQHTH